MVQEVVAIDLFCGAGGLTRGLIDAGIRVLKGYDLDRKVKDTYEKNNPGTKFYHKDIKDLTSKELLEGLNRQKKIFLLAGCAPCQPFSRINMKYRKNDKRIPLLLHFARLVDETKPDLIFLENVPGLARDRGRHIFSKFQSTLQKNGYNYVYDVHDAKEYGVPQKRKRLVLIASRLGGISMPVPTHGPRSQTGKGFVTVRETIEHYPKINDGEYYDYIDNHQTRKLSDLNKLRISYVKRNGGSRTDLPKKLQLKCHNNYKGHNDVYGRMKWDDVAPTLTCKCISISNGRFGHPVQNRGISVREAAALQTFDDNYRFYGSLTDASKWVGNSVPVKFAKEFGKVFIEAALRN